MRGLFRLKRHAHRLVNILFFGVFFVAGYMIAKGSNFRIEMIRELLTW